ncbi:DUF421 domain-containing protein [Mesobacillus foraminis]|uniref:DUF421 domain-containing protein n=1 Tax=Mesobacillus foraminis TaxID=279826 RepID=UPI001BE60F98|nr:DUF421 domain-containing protein [Mesobacillus foraminis]MBT2759169.1 DUF421 domain-containing protein [Mesobacillus foraminis]
MSTLEVIARVVIAFTVFFILARIMGRKEISQMTFYNFVSAVAIGSITANVAVNPSVSIRDGVLVLIGWTIFTIGMDYLDIKSKKARKITTGEPVMVIKNGKIMENALRKLRLDMDSLNAMLRQKNIFSLKDVRHAIVETNGSLSVVPSESKTVLTKGDMNIFSQKSDIYPMATEVVTDGRVLSQNLSKLQVDEAWLSEQLSKENINSLAEVFYAEVQTDGSLYIDQKNDIH